MLPVKREAAGGGGGWQAEHWLGNAPPGTSRPTDCMPRIEGVNTAPLPQWKWDAMPLHTLGVDCGVDAGAERRG